MKTQSEIVEHYRSIRKSDFLGFQAEVLLSHLSFGSAKEFLKEDADQEKWGVALPLTEEAIKEEMRDYMKFSWQKVLDHRGISASRSVDKMEAWLWLLGDDEMVAFAKDANANYSQYGAPILKAISEKYGFGIPDDPRAARMAQGLPCVDGCDEGCGT
jgi:hypothetical protein